MHHHYVHSRRCGRRRARRRAVLTADTTNTPHKKDALYFFCAALQLLITPPPPERRLCSTDTRCDPFFFPGRFFAPHDRGRESPLSRSHTTRRGGLPADRRFWAIQSCPPLGIQTPKGQRTAARVPRLNTTVYPLEAPPGRAYSVVWERERGDFLPHGDPCAGALDGGAISSQRREKE